MSNLGPQQQNVSYDGLLQVDGGISSTLKPVQDGMGNMAGLWLSSTGASVTTSDTFIASVDGTQIPNSVPRLISDGFGDYVSVKDFGAVGDGITDDTVAIQNAFTAVGNGTVYLPAGTYKTSAPIVTYGSWFGAGRATVIKPNGNFHAFEIQSAHLNGDEFGHCGMYTVDYSSAGALTSAAMAHWFNKGSTNQATSSTGGFRVHDIFVYEAYTAFYQSASDVAIFWNVSFENLMILACKDYGIYLDLTSTNATLQVDFWNVTVDGFSVATSKGVYFNGITKVSFDGIASGLGAASATGGSLYLVNCTQADIRVQTENFTISSSSFYPIALVNCYNVELDVYITTPTINVGAGNFANFVYIDANPSNTIIKRLYVLSPNIISGGYKKLLINAGATSSNTILKVLDKTLQYAECSIPSSILAATQFIDINVTTSGVQSNGWLKDNNNAIFESTPQSLVGTSATQIYGWVNNNNVAVEPQPAMLMVSGTWIDANNAGFVDLILVYASTNNAYPKILTVVSSNSVNGAHARTYTQDTSGNLLLAMATATYGVRATAIHGYAPYR